MRLLSIQEKSGMLDALSSGELSSVEEAKVAKELAMYVIGLLECIACRETPSLN